MKLEIKRMVNKEKGNEVGVYYMATIEGKEYSGHEIGRKLFGIRYETGEGIFDESSTVITLHTHGEKKVFNWNKIDDENPQIEIQRRVNEVKQWIANPAYYREYSFEVMI